MGLSGRAQNKNTVEDYVDYVTRDLMGITRQDLVYDIARHVDSSVHLFEQWGLPIWKTGEGKYVNEGRWQLLINGESYKVIVAEAAKNALGPENIYERIFILEPLLDGDRVAGAVGFSVRENKFFVFKAKAVQVAMGGAEGVVKPRSTGEDWAAAGIPLSAPAPAPTLQFVQAEMTCRKSALFPSVSRTPTVQWAPGSCTLVPATSALGEYMVERRAGLKMGPYGLARPIPANLRNYLGMLDCFEGKGLSTCARTGHCQACGSGRGGRQGFKRRR